MATVSAPAGRNKAATFPRIKIDLLLRWQTQIADDACDWARSQNGIPEARLIDYRAGIKQGMQDLLSTLQLHGYAAQIDYTAEGKAVAQ